MALFGGRAGRDADWHICFLITIKRPPPDLASEKKPHKGPNLTVAPARVYMAVVCRYELMGGDTTPPSTLTHTTHPPFGRMGAADR